MCLMLSFIAELSDVFFTAAVAAATDAVAAATDAVAAATCCYDLLLSVHACCMLDLSVIFTNHMHKL